MADPQMKEFSGRVRRIERTHRRGRGFEAAGTVGRSYYTRKNQKRNRTLLRPMLTVVLLLVTFKAAVFTLHGEEAYLERVAALKQGGVVSQATGHLMVVDPFTELMAIWFEPIFG
ncbi:hypothetical protein [Actibacterium sp. 188UL27-1]|uniref:hypothetical protein n=1 Tax=Actibacterium sp. 188UL27-1 TaxID=2786961 RepID=UPI00195D6CD9|nr:hypothetical protein [Actibacterium sp. 188UL27-1]MBM7066557.1 hypothetical protein [Actibacterium sp. 188UL27-1]